MQWKTIRLMLILELLLDIKYDQWYLTELFLHTNIDKVENIYVEMARGFNQKWNDVNNKALRL